MYLSFYKDVAIKVYLGSEYQEATLLDYRKEVSTSSHVSLQTQVFVEKIEFKLKKQASDLKILFSDCNYATT